jgi:hypothetical protein
MSVYGGGPEVSGTRSKPRDRPQADMGRPANPAIHMNVYRRFRYEGQLVFPHNSTEPATLCKYGVDVAPQPLSVFYAIDVKRVHRADTRRIKNVAEHGY